VSQFSFFTKRTIDKRQKVRERRGKGGGEGGGKVIEREKGAGGAFTHQCVARHRRVQDCQSTKS
jgi:hypothetical protein